MAAARLGWTGWLGGRTARWPELPAAHVVRRCRSKGPDAAEKPAKSPTTLRVVRSLQKPSRFGGWRAQGPQRCLLLPPSTKAWCLEQSTSGRRRASSRQRRRLFGSAASGTTPLQHRKVRSGCLRASLTSHVIQPAGHHHRSRVVGRRRADGAELDGLCRAHRAADAVRAAERRVSR